MAKYRVTQLIGALVFAGGLVRLVMPFTTAVGTVLVKCGNAIAFLDGQDKQAALAQTVTACDPTLRYATIEGLAATLIGLALLIVGGILGRRRKVLRRSLAPAQPPWMQQPPQQPFPNQPGAFYQQAQGAAFQQAPPQQQGQQAYAPPQQPPPAGPDAATYEQFMRIGRLSRPRTVLTFFAAVFVALVIGSVIAIALFLQHQNLENYIPYILAFDGVVAIVLIIGVLITITKDPARLMLSEITSQNAVALRRARDEPTHDAPRRTVREEAPSVQTTSVDTTLRRRWDDLPGEDPPASVPRRRREDPPADGPPAGAHRQRRVDPGEDPPAAAPRRPRGDPPL